MTKPSWKYPSGTVTCSLGSKFKLFNVVIKTYLSSLSLSRYSITVFYRYILDLSQLENEQTHKMRINLEGENIQASNVHLFFLLTISGTDLINTIVDLDDYKKLQRKMDLERKKFVIIYISFFCFHHIKL